MSVLLILLIASLLIASAFLGAFIWSVRSGQYDDDYTPSVRILFDDRAPGSKKTDENHKTKAHNVNGTKRSGAKRRY